MKYMVLIGEMAKNNVSIEMLSSALNIHRNTASNKLNGGSFSIEEAEVIRDTFFPGMELEYLFKKSSAPEKEVG